MLLSLYDLFWPSATPVVTTPTVANPVAAETTIVVTPAVRSNVPDAYHRLKRLVPASWFKEPTPDIDALLRGIASDQTFIAGLIAYAKAQSRLQTTTDGFLDIAAWDFFGPTFMRRPGETDAQFMPRLVKELTRPRLTRAAIIEALYDLTGNTATIIEPFNTGDCGAYGIGFAFAGQTPGKSNGLGIGGFGLNINSGCFYISDTTRASYSGGAGYIGSLAAHDQFFLTIARPGQQGVPYVSGFSSPYGGFGVGSFALISENEIVAPVTDQDIYDTINSTKAAGTTCWVDLTGTPVGTSPSGPDVNADSFDGSYDGSFS